MPRYLKQEDGLTATRSAMRTYLRSIANCLNVVPVHEKAANLSKARDTSFMILKLRLIPFFTELKKHDDDVDAGDEESANVIRANRIKQVDALFAASVDVINKNAGDQLLHQKNLFIALLTPRQSFGLETWHDGLRLLVKKLPGGKVLAKQGGPWQGYISLYYSSLVHEADVVMYLLLITLTLDSSLVQYFIASPKFCQDVIDLHGAISEAVIDVDRSECAALPDEEAERRGVNWNQDLSDLLAEFVTPKKKKSQESKDAEEGEEVKPQLKMNKSLQMSMRRALNTCLGS